MPGRSATRRIYRAAKAGDFIHVPPCCRTWRPMLTDASVQVVVVRSTATPIVVNLPDDLLGLPCWAKPSDR